MKIISSEERYRSPIFRVTEDHAVDPGGFEIRRAIVRHAGSAVIFAVDSKKRILLERQYRLPASDSLWEIPAGRLDPGEKPLQAARRELAEETGYKAKSWKKLASFFPSPGFVAEKMHLFLATELTAGEPTPMEDERIETAWVKSRQLDEWIQKGKVQDAKTLIAFLMWKRYR